MATWEDLIQSEMKDHGESWIDVVSSTLTDEELTKKFDDDYGATEGVPFTLWTKSRVYFPVVYDGSEWCGSVARHPDGKPTCHLGGG